jgi:glycosyltransferase involved in cell wall biosynthesis
VRDLVPDDDRIRLIHISDGFEIGGKRNFGCERARGEVVIHWDDDDESRPERMADQIGRLIESGKSVTGYHSMLFTNGARWWQYTGERDYSLGTSLCYRRDWWAGHPFPALQIGEDSHFVAVARDAGQLVTADAAGLMYATVHQGNTSPRNMGDRWKLCA